MKKYFQHFQTFHTHQKICSLSERDVTISYSMDYPKDDSEKSSFSNSKVGMHDSRNEAAIKYVLDHKKFDFTEYRIDSIRNKE